MSTLQAIDQDNGNAEWVAVPLEMIDWLAHRFGTPFFVYLASLDPYADTKISVEMFNPAVDELRVARGVLSKEKCDVPDVVDLFGRYGRSGAIRTVTDMIGFFEQARGQQWSVINIGD